MDEKRERDGTRGEEEKKGHRLQYTWIGCNRGGGGGAKLPLKLNDYQREDKGCMVSKKHEGRKWKAAGAVQKRARGYRSQPPNGNIMPLVLAAPPARLGGVPSGKPGKTESKRRFGLHQGTGLAKIRSPTPRLN